MNTQALAQPLAAFSDGLADVVESAGAGVVALQARRSYPSSGVIVRPGIVVTAAPTLRRGDGIAAVLPDGTATSATLVGVDASTDIAVLRLEASAGEPLTFGDAASVRPGHF